ncbi:MAG: DNA mismatch repair protein MutS [Proteobacteria bacterium]|nr:DNA mismatch repair protein MutS [Pseudomonadota bacterium]
MMQQYNEIKSRHPGYLLFYRMGDFYELFGDDALTASGILSITLTQRRASKDEDGIPMCGVPFHAAEGYIAKLLDKGHKVALCEQVETPEEAKARGGYKALVKRDVVRLYTGGTLTEDSMLRPDSNNYLAAICQSGGDMALGWLDMSTGEFCTAPTGEKSLEADLSRLAPTEILVTEKAATSLAAPLVDWQHLLTTVRSGLFDTKLAEERLKGAYAVGTLDSFAFDNTAQLAVCGALLAYVEETQAGRQAALQRPVVQRADGFMHLDNATRSNLELTRTLRGERKGSLLDALDRTITAPGARLLAQWLNAPLQERTKIVRRHDGIAFFLGNPTVRDAVRDHLRSMADIGRSLARISLDRGGPRDLHALRQTLNGLPLLMDTLATAKDKRPAIVADVTAALTGFGALADTLHRAMQDDNLPLLTRDGGFIRDGFCPELDRFRKLSTSGLTLLQELEQDESKRTGIPSLKVKYNKVWGYFIEVTNTHLDKVPNDFIHRQTTTSSQRFSTPRLIEIERDVTHAGSNALGRETQLFAELCAQVKAQAPALLAAAEALATLDVLSAGALLAERERMVRPTMTDDRAFDIVAGRHPVVAQTVANFIPNNTDLTDGKLWLITGPNMAGKSTFLRQNALIALMAQAGLYVPAESVTIGVVDRIFTRIGAADDLARGQSTFMVEMVETAAILNHASKRSLVILDEIGRGTATFDGLSIAWGCVEYLVKAINCRGLFATHYHELTVLEKKLPSLSCHHVAVQEWQNDIVFLHEVRSGASPRSYGIHVGRLAGLPAAVTTRAEEILKKLDGDEKTRDRLHMADQMSMFAMPTLPPAPKQSEVEQKIIGLDLDEMTPRQAHELLYSLRKIAKEGAAS